MTVGDLDRRRFGRAVLGIWLMTAAVMLALVAGRYWPLDFSDPDDVMRLLQVRDLVAGQAWFDVTQYRVNPPLGGPMHWSRLVDIPIAALILLLRPLLGGGLAESAAAALTPMLLLGALFWAFSLAARRLGSLGFALFATLLLAVSGSVLIQFMPLRIDHHGWQILMAGIAFAAALDPQPRRSGLVAGAALAVWLQVSTEALPYAALWGAIFGLLFIADARAWPRLLAYLTSLAGISALLLIVCRGPQMLQPWCDAMSPTYLLPLIGAALFTAVAHSILGASTPVRRLLVLAIAGIGAAILFLMVGRPCLAGPFASLDPIVYRHWYLQIAEGRPIWEQDLSFALLVLLPALVGLTGSAWAARSAEGEVRRTWLITLGLGLGALAIALTVARAMSVAHLLALPGNAWLLVRLYRPIPGFKSAAARVFSTVALALLTPFGLALLSVTPGFAAPSELVPTGPTCANRQGLAPLNRLTPGTVLAPLDISADILLNTSHKVIGTSHHRNRAGMRAVLQSFILPEPQAHAAVLGTQAIYLAWCPHENEVEQYERANPRAFIRDLERGRVPAWLQPLPSNTPLKIYRVLR